ncbi:MAG: hypoxanthine-guanine phosphoribosyltransferase [Cirrosporium novae-zelandiae]|nr:MAG: hypoxanthine-guanine phosphoribosyltransferase [Cirrosporium novae-zelandiae]
MSLPVTAVENIVKSFRALHATQRAEVPTFARSSIQGIVSELTSLECIDAKERLLQRSFLNDPLQYLPGELIDIIAHHLDPLDLIRARQVSKKWYSLFTSADFCKSTTRHHFPREEHLLRSPNPDWAGLFASKTRRQLALATGRPYYRTSIPFKQPGNRFPERFKSKVAYHNGWIASTEYDDQAEGTLIAKCRCLRTGISHKVIPRNRENILSIGISDSLMAVYSTQGICYCLHLESGDMRWFRLPSARHNLITLQSKTVALYNRRRDYQDSNDILDVFLWNFDHQKLVHQEHEMIDTSAQYRVFISRKEDAFFLFSLTNRAQPCCAYSLRSAKYDFHGNKISSSELILCEQCPDSNIFDGSHAFVFAKENVLGNYDIYHIGEFRMLTETIMHSGPHKGCDIGTDIFFDLNTEKFVKRRRAQNLSDWQRQMPSTQHDVYHVWDKSLFRSQSPPTRINMVMMKEFSAASPFVETDMEFVGYMEGSIRIICDETFFLLCSYEEATVWCFDRDEPLVNSSSSYFQHRMAMADARAQYRKALKNGNAGSRSLIESEDNFSSKRRRQQTNASSFFLQVHKLCQASAERILNDFKPNLMIAIGGGGYVPARILRSFLKRPGAPNIPIQAIGLSLYENLGTIDSSPPTTTTTKSNYNEVNDGKVELPGTVVTRTQWLDLSSLHMSNLVGKNILIVDEVDDTRTTLEYAVKELEKDVAEAARRLEASGVKNRGETKFSIFVLHNKDKPKKGCLPDTMFKENRYLPAVTVPDVWICYPWEATDIDEHDRLAAEQGQKQGPITNHSA